MMSLPPVDCSTLLLPQQEMLGRQWYYGVSMVQQVFKIATSAIVVKQLNDIALLNKSSQRGVICHMGSHSVTCHLADTSERAPSNPSQTGWYSINLPRRDGRLS